MGDRGQVAFCNGGLRKPDNALICASNPDALTTQTLPFRHEIEPSFIYCRLRFAAK